jgi:hypothetical protein
MSLLHTGHLRFQDSGLYVTFPSSKTDQLGQGEDIFILGSPSFYCPVRFMFLYLQRLNYDARLAGSVAYVGPLFPALRQRTVQTPDGARVIQLPVVLAPFTYNAALQALRRLLRVVGVPDPECYGLHSGRRGGATTALNAGCPFLFVKRQGRWKSDSVPLLYVDPDFESLCAFSRFLTL